MRSSPFFKVALLLGLLSAIGQSLHAGIGAVLMSLTVFFLSLGAGQLRYGPLSDMVGCKPPLYAPQVLTWLPPAGARSKPVREAQQA